MVKQVMRILFYGNQLKHYYYAKWLRRRGHVCTLYLLDKNDPYEVPEWDDPELKGNYPHWIKEHYQPVRKIFNRCIRGITNLKIGKYIPLPILEFINRDFHLPRKIKKISKDYDLVFTSRDNNIVPALEFDIPIVFMPIGCDITQIPFKCSNMFEEVKSYIYRKKIHKVKRILIFQKDMYWASLLLKIKHKTVHYPMIVDVDEINKLSATIELKKYAKYNRVFLLPARKNIDANKVDYKGTEKFLRAYKRLDENTNLISVMHGHDTERVRKMILDMGIDCDFIEERLPLYKLTAYMKMDNCIVFDDFGFSKTHLTGVAREALSVGGIVVDSTKLDCPVHTALSEEEIYNQMKYLIYADLKEHRKKSIEWAYENLHWDNRIDELIDILEQAMEVI